MSINWDDHKELLIVKDSLQSRYELLEFLGEGGYGKVFKLKDKSLERECALKVLNIDRLNEAGTEDRIEKKARFIIEAKAYAKCPHPNIVPIFDIGDKDTFPYFIMEYIKGENLKEVIATNGRLPLADVLKISDGVLSAVGFIHQHGLVHRDIKPANIMIEKRSGRSIIIDFGIAKDLTSALTVSGIGMGTPYYMAPEQFTDSSKVTQKTDIYSFGVVMYEMLTGLVPFNGKNHLEIMNGHLNNPVPNIREKNHNLPVGIEKVLYKAMAREPKDRHESAGAFLTDIKQLDETQKLITTIKKKPTMIEALFKIKYSIYIISGIIATILATFIVIKSFNPNWQYERLISIAENFIKLKEWEKAGKALTVAKEIKDTEEIKVLWRQITLKRADEEYHNILNTAKEYIKKGDYTKAQELLEKAKKDRGRVTDEIAALYKEIDKEIDKEIESRETKSMEEDFKALKEFLSSETNDEKKIEKCRDFQNKYQNLLQDKGARKILDEINQIIEQLNTKINGERKYREYINTVNNLIRDGDYEKAKKKLDKTSKKIKQEDVKRLSEEIENEWYTAINNKNITLDQYLTFKRYYSQPSLLKPLKDILKDADKELPPEKYWDNLNKKNEKDYYEHTFTFTYDKEQNQHRMIYIPKNDYTGNGFWIDKYEVSWAQFKKLIKIRNIDFRFPKKGICEGDQDNCPAVVKYEEAKEYCEIFKFELPNKEQWEYAASGGKAIDYPWGNELPDDSGLYRANFTSTKDGYTFIAPVKSYENLTDISQIGLVNMSGNVWEWVEDRICKGGGFLSKAKELKIKHDCNLKDEAGFRCILKEVEK